MALVVRRARLDSAAARPLITALDDYLGGLYPPEANFTEVDGEALDGSGGAFLLAFDGDDAVGCGAIRRISDAAAEIKRMYVVPGARGRGIGRRLLGELEAWARAAGLGSLVLETGPSQPEALGLYRAAGFHTVPCWGPYAEAPNSLCLQKELTAAP